jgi:pyruvate formate lyase activating enzyme
LVGTKADLSKLRESIELLMDGKVEYEFRTTVVPTMLNFEDIVNIAREIEGAEKYVLQQFEPAHAYSEKLRAVRPYDRKTLESMAEACRKYVKQAHVRGAKS